MGDTECGCLIPLQRSPRGSGIEGIGEDWREGPDVAASRAAGWALGPLSTQLLSAGWVPLVAQMHRQMEGGSPGPTQPTWWPTQVGREGEPQGKN